MYDREVVVALQEAVLSWLVGVQSPISFGLGFDVESGVKVRKCAYLEVQRDDTKVTRASRDPWG